MKAPGSPYLLFLGILINQAFLGLVLFLLFPLDSWYKVFIFLGLGGFLLIGFIGWIRRVFLGPLRRVSKQVHQISGNDDIDLTLTIPPTSSGALNQVIGSLNHLTNRLNLIFLDISRSTRKFNLFASDIFFSARHVSEEALDQSQGMGRNLNQVRSFQKSLEDLEAQLTLIRSQLTKSTEIHRELETANSEATHLLEPLLKTSERTLEEAGSGTRQMERSTQGVTQLANLFHELNRTMTDISQRMGQIGSVLETLNDITERTHILATNASIEAARAGRHGAGFGVIAGEIRALSTNSRKSILEIGDFLRQTRDEIMQGAERWALGAQDVGQVKSLSEETQKSLSHIGESVREISLNMEAFARIFTQQNISLGQTIGISTDVQRSVQAFSDTLGVQAQGYQEIAAAIQEASNNAETASHAAKVMSQLGTYLRVGGQELKYVVTKFRVSEERSLGGIARKEPRKILLYNLEVFEGEQLLGHLGDLSLSGLMLYSETELSHGAGFQVAIRLPLGFGETSDLLVRITPRRTEKDAGFFRIGCSLELVDDRKKDAFLGVLEKLTINDVEEVEELESLDPL